MSNILVSGSIAYDYIMDYKDKFKNNIMPDKLRSLNVAFIVDRLEKSNGGCGANICYSLALLDEKPILFGAVGFDFEILEELKDKINYKYLYRDENIFSARAHVTTDLDDNQITAFYPGAMNFADRISVSDVKEEISYAIAAPNYEKAMIKVVKECSEKLIKCFFDPGQQLSILTKDDLLDAVKYSNYLIVNDYEFTLFKKKTGLNDEDLLNNFDKIIITLGSKGAQIIDKEGSITIPVVKTDNIIDPTGAGDSFRAGLLKGLKLGYDWETAAKIGSLTAHYCIQEYGTQKHKFTVDEFKAKFKEIFGINIKFQ